MEQELRDVLLFQGQHFLLWSVGWGEGKCSLSLSAWDLLDEMPLAQCFPLVGKSRACNWEDVWKPFENLFIPQGGDRWKIPQGTDTNGETTCSPHSSLRRTCPRVGDV